MPSPCTHVQEACYAGSPLHETLHVTSVTCVWGSFPTLVSIGRYCTFTVTSTLSYSPLMMGATGLDADLVLEWNVGYILVETSVIIPSCTCLASFRGNVVLVLWYRVLIFCFAVLSGCTVDEVGGVGCICVLLVHRYLPCWLADIRAKIIDTSGIQIKQITSRARIQANVGKPMQSNAYRILY